MAPLEHQSGQGSAREIAHTVWSAVRTNLGNSTVNSQPQPRSFGGWTFPVIPPGAATTIIPVPFPVTTEAPSSRAVVVEELEVLAILCLAGMLWALPWFCINRRLCCKCFRRWMSRRLGCYFLLGLVVNAIFISAVIAREPDVSANDIFFAGVHFVEVVSERLEQVLMQCSILLVVFVAFTFRNRIVTLLGYDHQLVRCDLRDVCTCFTMARFCVVEVAIWKIEGLPSGFSRRSLFVRVLCGYNEPLHTRPHDGCTTELMLRERVQLNYDPEDDTQRLSLIVKQQEVVGAAVSQLAPVAGALAGGVAGLMTPVGPAAGAGVGVVTGLGAANSFGQEVARVDLSCAMVNRIRDNFTKQVLDSNGLATGPTVLGGFWNDRHFMKTELVPQGTCWLRICDVPDP